MWPETSPLPRLGGHTPILTVSRKVVCFLLTQDTPWTGNPLGTPLLGLQVGQQLAE